MRFTTITICAAVLLFSCNSSDTKSADASTDDTKVAAASTTEKSENIPDSVKMKNWMAYMTPGKEHEMMAGWNGTWSGDVTMWMAPGTPPSTSKSTTVNKMAFGGRYQLSEHKGEFNGQPFEGMSTLAFDNARKVFVSTWIDNMGTGIMKAEGAWDAATNSVTLTGKAVNAETNKECDFREVFKVTDADHQVMEMYAPGPDGKEFKTMEIRYTRKK